MTARRTKTDWAAYVAKAERLQARYTAQREAYRRQHPDRGHEIDERCAFLAPPELRVRIGGME